MEDDVEKFEERLYGLVCSFSSSLSTFARLCFRDFRHIIVVIESGRECGDDWTDIAVPLSRVPCYCHDAREAQSHRSFQLRDAPGRLRINLEPCAAKIVIGMLLLFTETVPKRPLHQRTRFISLISQ